MYKLTDDQINFVKYLYDKCGYGYDQVARDFKIKYGLSISPQTVKRIILREGLSPHEPAKIKVGSPSWYKREYERLVSENKSLVDEVSDLKIKIKHCEDELSKYKALVSDYESKIDKLKSIILSK